MVMNTEAECVTTMEAVLRDKDGNIKQVWATPGEGETPEDAHERVIAENQVGEVEPKEGVTFDEMVAALGTAVEAAEKESE